MHRVIQWSGGIDSWATAELVVRQHPNDEVTLLFADVLIEDSDPYRFNADASAKLGIPITRVCDGRTPFDLFRSDRFLGNARIAPCSRTLKQLPCRRWLDDHLDPANTVLYVGLEPSERRRVPGIAVGWKPWRVEFPLLHHTSVTKDDLLAWCRTGGLTPPRLYRLGFSHNNCGGPSVRGGQAHWHRTLREFPDRFQWYEQQERRFRAEHGDVAILKRRHRGRTSPLPLQQLRAEAGMAGVHPRALVDEGDGDLARYMRVLGLGELPRDRRHRLAVARP